MTNPLDRLTPAQRDYAKANLSQTVTPADDWTTDPLPEGGEGAEIEVDWGGGLFVATWRDGQWWVYNMAQPEGWDADGLRWRWVTRPAEQTAEGCRPSEEDIANVLAALKPEQPAEVQDTPPPFTATADRAELVTRVREQEAQIESLLVALREVRESDSAQVFLLKTALENVRAERDAERAMCRKQHGQMERLREERDRWKRKARAMAASAREYRAAMVYESDRLTKALDDVRAELFRLAEEHAGTVEANEDLQREREAVAEYVAWVIYEGSDEGGDDDYSEAGKAAVAGPDALAAAAMKARQ